MDELLANCEECGKPISPDFKLCADCLVELHGYESDEFDQNRASKYDA